MIGTGFTGFLWRLIILSALKGAEAPPPFAGQAADTLVHMVLWLVLLISLLAPASFHILSCLALSRPPGPDVFVQSKQRRSEALTQTKS